MTHDEVTAAMKAEDVDVGLVEKAARAIDASHGWKNHAKPSALAESTARHALAAVLPEIQAQAWDKALAAKAKWDQDQRYYSEDEVPNPYRTTTTGEPTT